VALRSTAALLIARGHSAHRARYRNEWLWPTASHSKGQVKTYIFSDGRRIKAAEIEYDTVRDEAWASDAGASTATSTGTRITVEGLSRFPVAG
jgi:hypothetical protein